MRRLAFVLVSAVLGFAAPAVAEELAPEKIAGVTTIDAKAAKALYDAGVPFVDTRSDGDWEAGRVAGAYHLDSKKVTEADLLKVVKSKAGKVVLYCNGIKCLRSSEVAVKAVEWGFTNLSYLREGLPAWKAANYPVE